LYPVYEFCNNNNNNNSKDEKWVTVSDVTKPKNSRPKQGHTVRDKDQDQAF